MVMERWNWGWEGAVMQGIGRNMIDYRGENWELLVGAGVTSQGRNGKRVVGRGGDRDWRGKGGERGQGEGLAEGEENGNDAEVAEASGDGSSTTALQGTLCSPSG
jgi:hypothetical protein